MLRVLMKPVGAVIHGGSDIGVILSEDELQQTFDLCQMVFAPTTLDKHRATEANGLNEQATDNPGPGNTNPKFVDGQSDARRGELDMSAVLDEANVRTTVINEHGVVHNFESEALGLSDTGGGWVARLEKGRLGLVAVEC
jgi:hypothetical protein